MEALQGQTILITGSTDGIGAKTAHMLAEQGAHVLVHGRDDRKASRVVEEIQSATGNDHVEKYIADLSSLDKVRQLAQEVRDRHAEISVLINNAGVGLHGGREISQDGYELRFAVNYLAPFLLTQLLLEPLQRAATSRIVNVSSAGQGPVDFDDLMLEKRYDAQRAYRQSKLALVMFTMELADRLKDTGVTVNSLHPGTYLNTKMVRDAGIRPWGSVDSGAEAVVYLATAPGLKDVSGRYFDRKKESRAHAQAYDRKVRQKLWQLSEQYTGALYDLQST